MTKSVRVIGFVLLLASTSLAAERDGRTMTAAVDVQRKADWAARRAVLFKGEFKCKEDSRYAGLDWLCL